MSEQLLDRYGIFILLVVGLVLRAATAQILPFGEYPDEKAHMLYVQDVMEHWTVPLVDDYVRATNRYEHHQAPLYYFVAAVFGTVGTAFGLPLLGVLRGLAVLIGEVTIFGAWRFYPGNLKTRQFFAALWALWPSIIQVHAGVGNDALAICFGVIGTGMLFHVIRGSARPGTGPTVGLLFGLATLCKANAAILVPGIVFAAFLRRDRMLTWRDHCRWSFRAVLPAVLIVLPWVLLNLYRYGNPAGAFYMLFPPMQIPLTVSFVGWALLEFVLSFWAVFGRTNCVDVAYAVRLFGLVVIFLMAGGISHCWRQPSLGRRRDAMLAVWTLLASLPLLLPHAHHAMQFQGRHIIPIAGYLLWPGAVGVRDWRRQSLWVGFIVIGTLLCDIWVMTVDIPRYLRTMGY